MRWITATDLQSCSGRKEFETLLPELIRKLILASSTDFPLIHIPVGDSIYKPGWDGINRADERYEFVPQGLSLWEWGRDADFLGKCNKEYRKRTDQTGKEERLNATFVFITPKRWVKPKQSKEIMANTFRKLKEWKNVLLYDADDLELWIELHPAVGLWLARKLRLVPPRNIESAADFWRNFIDAKRITFSPDLIIAGREQQKSQIQHFLSGKPGTLEIQSISESEGIAFIIASAIAKGDEFAEVFFSRTIIVKGKEELREITSNLNNLYIIFSFQGNELIENGAAEFNHIFNTLDFKAVTVKDGIALPIPLGDNFAKALETVGLKWEEAYMLAGQSGRSFSALRRILTDVPGRIPWTENKDLRQLIPIFLLQRIDSKKKGDRLLIAKLAQMPFEEYENEIREWSLIPDTPVYLVSNYWRIVSSYDLFFAIAKFLTSGQLKRFEEVVYEVLFEIDPALELEPKMRMAAGLFEKDSVYSKKCKEGICHTLILISVFGIRAGMNLEFDPVGWVDGIVKKVLSNQELKFWQSIATKVHLMAEASPVSFLTCLEEMIENNPNAISSMFKDSENDWFSPTYHTHILWALESLAWDSSSFSRVVFLLAQLVELDEGSSTANRPLNSLRHIFLLWLPQTSVSISDRGKVIESLIRSKKETALKILLEIAPKSHDISYYSHRFLWRNREFSNEKVTLRELEKAISWVCEKLIQVIGSEPKYWIQVIDLLDDFFEQNRTRLIDSICLVQFDGSEEAFQFREKLRKFIARHEIYSEQDWAISFQDLKRLKTYHSGLLTNDIDRFYWYFNVETIETKKTSGLDDKELYEKTIILRNFAVAKINQTFGMDGIIQLAILVDNPWVVGRSLAFVTNAYQYRLFPLLERNSSDKLHLLAKGYCFGCYEKFGFEWVEKKVRYLVKEKLSQGILVQFFLAIPPSLNLWELLRHTSIYAHHEFWKMAYKNNWFLSVTEEELDYCIETLNQFGRFTSSLNLIGPDRKKIPVQLLIETLKGFMTHPMEEDTILSQGSHTIIELFKRLDGEEIEPKTMQLLEWLYFSVLNNSGRERPIKHLFDALSDSPTFFAEIVAWYYLPENKAPEKEISHLQPDFVMNRAGNAHSLLESWTGIPGYNSDGSIDREKLEQWIKEAVLECEKRDRISRGYYEIGKLFGKCKDVHNFWPAPELCEIIEQIGHKELDEGFVIGAIIGSKRRVTIRPAGSNPDRPLVDHYSKLSKSIGFQYPKVGRLLMEISKHHEHWADYQEVDNKRSNLDY